MTALVRLYPRAWRDRYEEEFLDLLEARPPSVLDRIDILLGAVDARLHPEVPGSRDPHAPDRAGVADPRRLGGLLVILGGLGWAVGGILLATSPFTVTGGYRDVTVAMMLFVVANLLVGIGASLGSGVLGRHARAGRLLGLAMAVASVLIILPWPFLVVGIYLAWVIAMVYGGFMIDGDRLGLVLVVGAILAFGTNTEDSRALLTVPYGVAWITVGLRVVVPRSRMTAGPIDRP